MSKIIMLIKFMQKYVIILKSKIFFTFIRHKLTNKKAYQFF